jgi:hypothetical protein
MFKWNRIHIVYEGIQYKKASEWWLRVIEHDTTQPIKYLEIGVFYGIHLFEIASIFPNASLFGIDPWIDYSEYSEYKGQQNTILDGFKRNLSKCPNNKRIQAYRGLSNDIVPTFQNDFFDIIYVDGNHETDYVYKDGLMSFQKCKPGGYIVFDDSDWPQTLKGIQKFEEELVDKIKIISDLKQQRIYRKI